MKISGIATIALLTVLATPIITVGQLRADRALLEAGPVQPIDRCGGQRTRYARFWDALLASVALEADSASAVLTVLEDTLRALSQQRPRDVALQYLLAGVLGAQAERASGFGQIEAAKAVHAQVTVVLDLEADHAGAQHILGRLHHEVLRMSRVKRFLALRVLGGAELAGASWDDAQRLLEAGAVGVPCSIEAHFDLARLQAERGNTPDARDRLTYVLDMRARSARDSLVIARARALLERLDNADRTPIGS